MLIAVLQEFRETPSNLASPIARVHVGPRPRAQTRLRAGAVVRDSYCKHRASHCTLQVLIED